jgi:U4/U6 small nuclear ribonucleoprotein PRP4
MSPLTTLQGHSARVCRTEFHPSGRYLASASFDGTWRFWDVERGVSLLEQEGHSKEVYAVNFQGDGALLCSGFVFSFVWTSRVYSLTHNNDSGLDAIGRVWDLRSGKTAMVLDGHTQDILAIDFSPNGSVLPAIPDLVLAPTETADKASNSDRVQ